MKVLHLSYADNGGCSHFQSECLNHCTPHQARFVRMRQNYLDYPIDIQAPSIDELMHWYNWADVLHIHDNAHHIVPEHWPLKAAVMQYHGSHYRANSKACQWHCQERHWPIGVSTLDLVLFGGDAAWLPNAREDMSHLRKWKQRSVKHFTVIHAPTQRFAKSTDQILPTLRQLEREGLIKLLLVERQSIRECMRTKGYAHLLIDQFLLGYGSNAIEAWAIGMPVISNAMNDIPFSERLRGLDANDILAKIKEVGGSLPFAQANFENLRHVVLRMRNDAKFWQHWRDVGRQYWQDFHSQEAVAKRLVPLYERAIADVEGADRETIGRYGRKKRKPTLAGMKLVEYIGPGAGSQTWFPPGGESVKLRNRQAYVTPKALKWFLNQRDKRKRPLFREVK